MSRTNQTNNELTPRRSSSSSSELESSSVHRNYFTFNFTINYLTPAPQQPDAATLTSLIGQQISDIVQQKKAARRRTSATRRSSSKPSKEVSFQPEVDTPQLPKEREQSTSSATQEDRDQSEVLRQKKSRYSCEYQDLSSVVKPHISYRLVPSKNVKAVPEDELPKRKFCADQKRREYVVLGRLNSIEPIEEKDEKTKEEERKRRSRELARELY